jgi:hypothetical protein
MRLTRKIWFPAFKVVLCRHPAWLCACIALSACSVHGTRYFSEPEDHAAPVAPYSAVHPANPGLTRFEGGELPARFMDSISRTVVTARFRNEHVHEFIGPPIIPLIPVRSGYGHSHGSKTPIAWEDKRNVILELTIDPGPDDRVTFDPHEFRIKSGKGKSGEATVISVDGETDVTRTIVCNARHTWKVIFSPGVEVADLPILFLHSLSIGTLPFHPEGIPFHIGKRVFYSPLIMPVL